MNEIILSNNLNQIELEIRHHKQIAGQSIWEIGRRLNHVKENDLAHGQFINWVERMGMNRSEAYRFMKVAKEIPNDDTWKHLGNRALYLIATLPEEDREKEHALENGETKQVDEMTVRELQEVKRKLREKDRQLERAQKSEQIAIQQLEQEQNKEPEVIEKEVMKEVEPHDYEELKQNNKQLKEIAEDIEGRNKFIEAQYQKLLDQRAEVDEKSQKYDQLTEAIENAEGKLNNTQKLISDYNKILSRLRKGNEVVMQLSGLAYLEIAETVNNSSVVSREFDSLIYSLESLTRDLREMRSQNIIEGEFING